MMIQVIYVTRRLGATIVLLNVSTTHIVVCKWTVSIVCQKRASIYALTNSINQKLICKLIIADQLVFQKFTVSELNLYKTVI